MEYKGVGRGLEYKARYLDLEYKARYLESYSNLTVHVV
jgi:hypothetical protein